MSSAFTSVIICTRDRHASFQRSLGSVLAQRADDFEVIVVDGSSPPVELPEDAPVPLRVIREQCSGEGSARAAGLRAASGDLIAWCDDDAVWTPDHLEVLRAALLADPALALVAGAGPPVMFTPVDDRRRNGSVAHPPPEGFLLPASDVLHRKHAAWDAGGFDFSLGAYAGGDLWARIIRIGAWRQVPQVVTIHQRAEPIALPDTRRKAAQRLQHAWRDDAQRWERARTRLRARAAGYVPFDPDTWRDGRRELIFATHMHEHISFAAVARQLIARLTAHGVQVTTGYDGRDPIPPGWEGIASRSIEPRNRLALVYEPPDDRAALGCERVVRYAMWETTVVPPSQVAEINGTLTMLYVPSRANACIARENGVDVPVRVLHHGVDPQRFPLLERPRRGTEPFVFGCYATLQTRKGTDLLIRAFLEEFAPSEPVRLALKHTYDRCRDYAPSDPRITLTTGFFEHAQLLEYLQGLDAFVLPTRGEGFGLTGLEAMATGLPLICTPWSGPADYLDPVDTYPLRYQLQETGGIHFGFRRQFGYWAEPDIQDLRWLMRYVYEHREEAAAKGLRASARVHRDWTWDRAARQVIADFDLLAQGLTPAAD